MTQMFVGLTVLIVLILVEVTMYFVPETWMQKITQFSMEQWYLGPLFLLFGIVGLPLIIIWDTSRKSGVPFRIVAQSYWEYINAKNDHEKRLSTLKLVQTEKELEENK